MLELTEKNYHAVVTENFPQLPIETWEPLNEGWANRTFLGVNSHDFDRSGER